MTCECGAEFASTTWESSTCVGYTSPPGHDHDDNCVTRAYVCLLGHETQLTARNSCPMCDWRGKKECFCHKGPKLDDWPRLATKETPWHCEPRIHATEHNGACSCGSWTLVMVWHDNCWWVCNMLDFDGDISVKDVEFFGDRYESEAAAREQLDSAW